MGDVFNLNNIIGVLVNSFAYIYIWSKLLNVKINFRSAKYYIVQILFAITMMLNYLFINDIIRIIFLVLSMVVFSTILFNKSIINCIIASFFSQIIIMVSELIFAIIVSIVFRLDVSLLVSSYFLKMGANIVISIMAIIFSKTKFINRLYNLVLKLTANLKKYSIVFIIIVILFSINFIFASLYYNVRLPLVIIFNAIISIIYLFICFIFINTQNKYCKINNQYNTTINSLKEYEDILDAYRVSNHENKNQLLTVRSMIVKKEKNIPEYIDKIVDNKIKDDEKLMFDTNKIPAGGLRAVIYSKMLYMKENKIDFELKVNRGVRTVELIELGEDLILDVCKIIGVFLDNAIQAVETLDEKKVTINLFTDEDNLYIEITNNFEGIIDIEQMDNRGYTTKDNGHGYGLSLVKDILEHNKKLINTRKINKNIFVQNLTIKLK